MNSWNCPLKSSSVAMRTLLVTPSYFPIVGGSEILTRILAAKLRSIGIETDIMTFNMSKKWEVRWKAETVKEGSIKLIKVPALNLFGSANPLFNTLRMNVLPRPDFVKTLGDYHIIHFVGEADLGLPLLARFVKRPKLMQCVGIFRNGGIYNYYKYQRRSLGIIFRRYFPNLADIFVASSSEEKELLSELGVDEEKILILPLGVDVETFAPAEEKKIENLILFVGRVDRIKGLHVLIESLQHIRTPVQVAVIGPRWDEAYVKEMEKRSETVSREGRHKVMFLGAMSQQDLVPWYQKAAVLVCPYLYETYSNVVREAIACGTPVISTGSHISNTCSDGIILTARTPVRLAEAIENLLKNKNTRERCGKEGRRYAENSLSWNSIIKELEAIYKKMLARAVVT
jgi:glycosyltransferase involved in cell wall biosynthesis